MRLAPQETARFYHIWFGILRYTNSQTHIDPNFPATPRDGGISPAIAAQLRDAFWADDILYKQFLADNPTGLSDEDLALIASWQYRVTGTFYVLRSLQKYTVFLSTTTPAHAYGVLGLVSDIEDTLPLPPPVYTNAVLLPFGHRIIYDGLLNAYNISFGSGIRGNLQETYRNIQEREGIITSLLPEDHIATPEQQRKDISARNQKVLTAFRRELGKANMSSQTAETHVATISDFASTTLLHSEPPRGLLDLTLADVQSYLHGKSGKQPVTSFKRFLRFLTNTGRIDYSEGENMYGYVKDMGKGD